jgi:hypothetical protein
MRRKEKDAKGNVRAGAKVPGHAIVQELWQIQAIYLLVEVGIHTS